MLPNQDMGMRLKAAALSERKEKKGILILQQKFVK
jgi:hypothetical protein